MSGGGLWNVIPKDCMILFLGPKWQNILHIWVLNLTWQCTIYILILVTTLNSYLRFIEYHFNAWDFLHIVFVLKLAVSHTSLRKPAHVHFDLVQDECQWLRDCLLMQRVPPIFWVAPKLLKIFIIYLLCSTDLWIVSQKTRNRHCGDLVVVGGVRCCKYDNLWCIQSIVAGSLDADFLCSVFLCLTCMIICWSYR